jgi:hypothetical protein
MFSRLNLLLCVLAFMLLASCAGSKGGGGSYSYDDDDDGGGGGGGRSGGGRAAMPRADEIKDAHKEAVSMTEENHRLAKEVFDLKNRLGVSTDEEP